MLLLCNITVIVIFLHLINFGQKSIKPSFLRFKGIAMFCNSEREFLGIEQDGSLEFSWKENSDFEFSSELSWDLVSKSSLFYFLFVLI